MVKVKVFIQVKGCHNLHTYIGKGLTQVRSWSNYLCRLKVVIIFIHVQCSLGLSYIYRKGPHTGKIKVKGFIQIKG